MSWASRLEEKRVKRAPPVEPVRWDVSVPRLVVVVGDPKPVLPALGRWIPLLTDGLISARQTAASTEGKQARCAVVLPASGADPVEAAKFVRLTAPWWDVILLSRHEVGDIDRATAHLSGVLHVAQLGIPPVLLDAMIEVTLRRHAGGQRG